MDILNKFAQNVGGTIEQCEVLPDGSGFATMSMPLPKGHWSTATRTEYEAPPMRWRMGEQDSITVANRCLTRDEMADVIREAGKYAYRSATMGGQEPDLDPDALLQNLVVAFLGYWTHDGRTDDEWALPPYEQGKRA